MPVTRRPSTASAMRSRRCSSDGSRASRAPTTCCVEELLRFDPPLHLFTRYALQDLEIAGVELRRAIGSACCSAPPTAIPRPSPSPTGSISPDAQPACRLRRRHPFLRRRAAGAAGNARRAADPVRAVAGPAAVQSGRATATPTIFMGWRRWLSPGAVTPLQTINWAFAEEYVFMNSFDNRIQRGRDGLGWSST